MNPILLILINIFRLSENTPARLEKKDNKFENFCGSIAPYIIVACVIILCVLIFIALVKYGHSITGTESNTYYYHLNE